MTIIMTLLSTIALVLVSVTMLARANDLGMRPGMFWMVRRVGFVLAGFTPWAIIYFDWSAVFNDQTVITWWHVLDRVGLAMVFLTTPYLPPWWKWMLGLDGADQVKWADDRRGMPVKTHGRREGDST